MQMTADGQIHCLEVIIALIKKVLGDSPALNAMKVSLKIERGYKLDAWVNDLLCRLQWFKHFK